VKSFFDYIKKLAIQMVINQLKDNSDKLAKKIADKCEIPLLNEKQEAELASKLLDGMTELIEDLFEDDLKEKDAKG
tara:strand:- start:743 stop:970 length:228 start_codon:yes stop_codon:yes gene_type:complete